MFEWCSQNIEGGNYIACLYDGAWYVGYIRNHSEEHKDIAVEFMKTLCRGLQIPGGMCHGYHF